MAMDNMISENSLSAVSGLSPDKQLAFALLLFERMLPDLIAFSQDTGFDKSCYLRARDVAWSALQNGAIEQDLIDVCMRNAPDTEDFSHGLTSYALNAVLAISEILKFTADSRFDHITDIASLAGDSLYLYVSSLKPSLVSSTDKNRWIAMHPIIKEEQLREEEDIRFLSGLPDHVDQRAFSALKLRANTQRSLLPLAR